MRLPDELQSSLEKVVVTTRYGLIRGRRVKNGAACFLEVPYALPPKRFEDPIELPSEYRYDQEYEYIHQTKYAAQPMNDGQAADTKLEDKLGAGSTSENPLFLNIFAPPTQKKRKVFPVKIYIHGGFLQFGSPHGLSCQADYVTSEREEVWVNLGYRLSAFGFLANDDPEISGNFGFKDQWLGCQWVKENIESFGGDPNNITLTGLSAGAHSVHQLLHHVSLLPDGAMAPFQGVIIQSNAIANDCKSPSDLHQQYNALTNKLGVDPTSASGLSTLKDPSKVAAKAITKACESLTPYGTFRGASTPWLSPGSAMKHQRSPHFARSLKAKGVRFVIIGEMKEEWFLYSIAHPIKSVQDISVNLRRYYPDEIVERMSMWCYNVEVEVEKGGDLERLFGRMLSDGQVYMPVRLLHRNLASHGFPVLRYQIHWVPEKARTRGYITHGTDRGLWTLRPEGFNTPEQMKTARKWLDTIDEQISLMSAGQAKGEDVETVLRLRSDESIGWERDTSWKEMMHLAEKVYRFLPVDPEISAKL